MRKLMFAGVLVSSAVLSLTGCGDDGASSLPEDVALTIDSATAADGITGSYAGAEERLQFATARMPRDEVAASDDGRDFDIAIRLQDSTGTLLLLMTEGHAAPESWSVAGPPRKEGTEIYGLARMAADALDERELDIEVRLDAELLKQQLRLFGQGKEQDVLSAEDVKKLKLTEEAEQLKRGNSKAAVLVKQGIDSFWKPAFYNGSNADHTGTITYRYANFGGGWVLQNKFVNCNHGTCPGDPVMKYYITHWGPATYYGPVTPQMCSGVYGNPHVCNNDTRLQQHNVLNNQLYNTWNGDCGFTLLYKPW